MKTPSEVNHSIHHPNVPYSAQTWSAQQTLHVACAYTNPQRWRTRRHHMANFRRHMEESRNVQLYVGEAAYGDRPFEVTAPSAPLDFQFRTREELWHKENILNLLVARFPVDWEYGAYIDGDFHMTRPDWAIEAIHQLQHYDFVQLFSSYSDLSSDHVPLNTIPSFAHNYVNRRSQPGSYRFGSPGGAWAFRRAAFNKVGGFLDTCILGSGDWYMAVGLIGRDDANRNETARTTDAYRKSLRVWQDRAATVKKNIGVLNNHAVHYFHGTKDARAYGTRWQILVDHQFDPYADLYRDAQGLYQLTPNKPDLRDAVRMYMRMRNEDCVKLGSERPQV